MMIRIAILFIALGLSGCVSQPESPTASRPNILFCIADDASYPHMGAYGCDWIRTPGFDRVAENGILFNRAYTPNAKCAPSRACVLTGRNSWQLKEAGNHWPFFPAEFKVYTEALAEHGYFVGKTAKGWSPGIAKDAEGNPRHLAGTPFDAKTVTPPTTGISNSDYSGNFKDFLDAKPEETPWCFWYGGREPHRAYEYGTGASKGGKTISQLEKVFQFWPDNEVVRNDLLDYAFEIEYFDQHLVQMLGMLEAIGELENTIVVVTADNGMPFPRIKGQEYEMSNHLPLAIMWPKGIKNPGRSVDDYVSFIDFAPTFIEVAGLKWEETGMQPSPGRSLTEIFYSEKSGRVIPERDAVMFGKERHDVGRPNDEGYPIRGIVSDGFIYLHNYEIGRWPAGNPETGYLNCDGSPTKTEILKLRKDKDQRHYWRWAFGKRPAEELFNVVEDPECMNNLAENPEFQELKKQLAERLTAGLVAQEDPRMRGEGAVFESYIYADKGSQNFYERYMSGEKIRAPWVEDTDFEGPLTDDGEEQ